MFSDDWNKARCADVNKITGGKWDKKTDIHSTGYCQGNHAANQEGHARGQVQ